MRTIAIGSVLGPALALYREHWVTLIGLAAAVWIVTTVLTVFVAVATAAAVAVFLAASGLTWEPSAAEQAASRFFCEAAPHVK